MLNKIRFISLQIAKNKTASKKNSKPRSSDIYITQWQPVGL